MGPYKINKGGPDKPWCNTISPYIIFCPLACQTSRQLIHCSFIYAQKINTCTTFILSIIITITNNNKEKLYLILLLQSLSSLSKSKNSQFRLANFKKFAISHLHWYFPSNPNGGEKFSKYNNFFLFRKFKKKNKNLIVIYG